MEQIDEKSLTQPVMLVNSKNLKKKNKKKRITGSHFLFAKGFVISWLKATGLKKWCNVEGKRVV